MLIKNGWTKLKLVSWAPKTEWRTYCLNILNIISLCKGTSSIIRCFINLSFNVKKFLQSTSETPREKIGQRTPSCWETVIKLCGTFVLCALREQCNKAKFIAEKMHCKFWKCLEIGPTLEERMFYNNLQ